MAVTILKLDPPTNVIATLQSGGTLLANTTYYVRVTARTQINYYWVKNLTSNPSVEISFTTDSINRSALITWTNPIPPTGHSVLAFAVYSSTISNDYYRKRHGVVNGVTCTTNSYLISAPATTTGLDSFSTFPSSYNLPANLNKELGNVMVNITGTNTLQTIYNAFIAQGFSDYIFYDKTTFYCKGGLYIDGTTSGSLIEAGKVIAFLQGGIINLNPNCNVVFGQYVNNVSQNGCIIFSNLESKLYCQYIKLYHCFITPYLIPTYVSGWNQTGDIVPSINTGSDIQNILVDGMGFRGGGSPTTDIPNNMIVNREGYAYWTGESNNVKITANSGLFIYTSAATPIFRNYDYNTTTFHLQILQIHSGKKIKIYNSIFKLNLNITTDNIPIINWNTTSGSLADGEFPIEIYNSLQLLITDKLNIGLSNCNIKLFDKILNLVLSTTTDGNGVLASTDVMRCKIDWHGSSGIGGIVDNLNPFTLMVAKIGYKPYVSIFNFTNITNWQIVLESSPIQIDQESI